MKNTLKQPNSQQKGPIKTANESDAMEPYPESEIPSGLCHDRRSANEGDERSGGDGARPALSLILTVSGDCTDDNIKDHVRALGSVNWRSQVLLVDPEARTVTQPTHRLVSSARVTYRPIPQVVTGIDEALRAARHDTIVIVDSGVRLDAEWWNWLATRRGNPDAGSVGNSCGDLVGDSAGDSIHAPPMLASFQKSVVARRFKRILLALYHGLLRCLLKTHKSEYKSGVVVLNRAQARRLLPGSPEGESEPGTFRFETPTEMLALARIAEIPVEETETHSIRSLHSLRSTSEIRLSSKRLLRSIRWTLKFWWNRVMFPAAVSNDSSLHCRPRRHWQWAGGVGLLLATMALLFSNLDYPLFEPDEARNAQLALNVIESGDWMSLTLAGEPYWDKPPAQIWAIATSYKIFGVSPWSTRLPGTLATALTIMLTLVLGRRLVGFRPALMGATMLLLSSGFVLLGRYVTMDASLTACVFLTAVSLMLARRRIGGSIRGLKNSSPVKPMKTGWLMVAGVAAGIGVMVKGPVVLALAIPPVLMAYWLAGDGATLKKKRNLLFFVPVLLIAGPWFLATAWVHPEFLTHFFWKHHVMRFSNAFNHREPFWYYLPALLLMMFPVSYLLPSLVRFFSTRKSYAREMRTLNHGFLCLIVVWVIGLFSMSESKLPTYVLSALPPICLLMGVLLDKRILWPQSVSQSVPHAVGPEIQPLVRERFLHSLPWKSSPGLLVLSVAIVGGAAILFQMPWMAPAGLLLATGSGLAVAALLPWKSSAKPPVAWACLGILAFGFVVTSVIYLAPEIAHRRSIHAATSQLKRQPELESAPIVFFGRENYGFKVTLPGERFNSFKETETEAVGRFLQRHPNAIIISSSDKMELLRSVLPWGIELEESESVGHLYLSSRRGRWTDGPARTASFTRSAGRSENRSARIGQWKSLVR